MKRLLFIPCALVLLANDVTKEAPKPTIEQLEAQIANQKKQIEQQQKLLQAWYRKYAQCDIQLTQEQANK